MNGIFPVSLQKDTTEETGIFDCLDPRTRIIAAILFVGTTVALSSPAPLFAALALAICTAAASRMPLRTLLTRLMMLEGFMVVLLATLPFTTPGTTILTIGHLSASKEGLLLAFMIALKANAVVLMLLAQVGSLEPMHLGHALVHLGLPSTLVGLLLLTVRYIGVLDDEYRRLRRAMRTRAFRPATNPHTWRSLGWLMGMLLVRSNDRAHRLLQAMKCRGYTGRFFLIDNLAMTFRDWLYCLSVIATMTGLLLWNFL